ncbi:MAG: hypothetical protein K0R09_1140 [Clostridiales bacterium]|nr:hypothetical protein [Clostridiales bacterium]
MYQLYYDPNNHYPSQSYTPSDSYAYPNYGATRSEANITTALARINGGPLAPDIKGTVTFKDIPEGTMVCINVTGLPPFKPGTESTLPIGPHGFHIHENGVCEVGDPSKPFTAAGEHWNPTNQPHGNHAGDFPVLFSNGGRAYMCFFTNKFKVSDVIGKAVIIHESPDDYRSQPAGNAGKRLACGVIQRY